MDELKNVVGGVVLPPQGNGCPYCSFICQNVKEPVEHVGACHPDEMD